MLLQHGLFDSSDTWIVNEEKKCLAIHLARQGFDVWLGNNRGNKYCRQHSSISTESPEFWDFSFQEMGKYDLPAMVQEITKKTESEKISYVGHSQGTTQMFASLCSSDTSDFMNSKIDVFVALAPIVYIVRGF